MNEETVVATLDIESTIRNNEVGSFKANPHSPKNFAVLSGYKLLGVEPTINGVVCCFNYYNDVKNYLVEPPEKLDILVGHSLGFDLLYLYRNPKWREWLKTGVIWDTMIAEYIITGQESRFASLNELSAKYGGTQKDDKIKEYWDNGIDTTNIPNGELHDYWVEDLNNTEIAFLKQIHIAQEKGLIPLIKSQMEYRLATVEAEWNGMYFNKQAWKNNTHILDLDLATRKTNIQIELENNFHPDTPSAWFNVNSNDQISLLLFGGEQKFEVKKQELDVNGLPKYFKSGAKKGQPRYKKETIVHKVEDRIPLRFTEPMAKTGFWKTNEDVLEAILNDKSTCSKDKQLVNNILEYRALLKEKTSFMEPYLKMTWGYDSCIHQKYNHTVTPTGRISCSDPNLQQVVNSGD